jgi:hypothetical protein
MHAGKQRCAQPRRLCAITRVRLCVCVHWPLLSAMHTALRDRMHARRAYVRVSVGVCVCLRVCVVACVCVWFAGKRCVVGNVLLPPQLPARPAADVAPRQLRRQPAPRCAKPACPYLWCASCALMRAISEPAAVSERARSALAAEGFSRASKARHRAGGAVRVYGFGAQRSR